MTPFLELQLWVLSWSKRPRSNRTGLSVHQRGKELGGGNVLGKVLRHREPRLCLMVRLSDVQCMVSVQVMRALYFQLLGLAGLVAGKRAGDHRPQMEFYQQGINEFFYLYLLFDSRKMRWLEALKLNINLLEVVRKDSTLLAGQVCEEPEKTRRFGGSFLALARIASRLSAGEG